MVSVRSSQKSSHLAGRGKCLGISTLENLASARAFIAKNRTLQRFGFQFLMFFGAAKLTVAPGDIAGSPSELQTVAAGRAVNIQDIANNIQIL